MKIVQFKDGSYAIRSMIFPFSLRDLLFAPLYEYLDLEELQLDQEKYGIELWWLRNGRLFRNCTTKDTPTIKRALIKLEKLRILKKAERKTEKDYGVPVKL